MHDTPRAARRGIAVLAVAAVVNLAAGAAISLADPGRAADLWSMFDWCRGWLFDARSLYTVSDATTDYPPNAIVTLAPIALAPARWLVPIWIAGALALLPVLAWTVMRAASPRERAASALALPALLFLCWAAPRTLLQFSVLSMTLAALALAAAETRPLASGIALGLGLCKPHLAGPIALWMLITGRLRALAAALAVVVAGWAIYDARLGENPLTTAGAYGQVLGSLYAGAEGLIGHANIRGWARLLTADAATADALWIGLSVILLLGLCVLALRDRSRPLNQGGLAVPAMFCLWSLLVTYHNGNNFILALPAFAFLWFDDSRRGAAKWIPIAMLQAALIYDVPVRLARAPLAGGLRVAVDQFDRVFLLMTLAYVAAIWFRSTATSPAARAAPSPR